MDATVNKTLAAFHGDEALRSRLSAQLAAHAEAGHFKPGPLHWDGTQGSLVGCLTESADQVAWQELGLPGWLAPIADALCAGQANATAALRFGQDLLAAITPGSNLAPAGSALIGQLLASATTSLAPAAPEAALAPVLAEIALLHRRAASGEIDAAAWRSARRAATAVTDTLHDRAQRDLASLAETAAWDPARSRSTVFDTVRVWRIGEDARALRNYGWGDSEDNNIRTLLQSLYDTYLKPELEENPDSKLTVFDLLEQHHADDATRLRGMYATQTASHAANLARASATLLQALRDA